MKKIFIVFSIAALSLVACTKMNDNETPEAVKSFTVSMPDLSNGSDTKTYLTTNAYDKYNKLVWTAGDKLFITRQSHVTGHGNDFNYETYTAATGGNISSEFNYDSKSYPSYDLATGSGDYLALYSDKDLQDIHGGSATYVNLYIPGTQTYVANGIAPYTMPMYGKAANLNDISMKCAGNILRFNFKIKAEETHTYKITKIVLSAGGSTEFRAIAGRVAIEQARLFDGATNKGFYGTYKYGSSLYEVTLDCGAGVTLTTTATPFNIVFSHHFGAVGESLAEATLTAQVYYTVDGGAETAGPVIDVATKLDATTSTRKSTGVIFNFGEKNIEDYIGA